MRKERAPWAAVGRGEEVRRIEGWPVTTGQNTMHFHRLTLARIKTTISAAQSLWLTYLFILSEKVLSGGKKTCGANWVVLQTEGFPGMQDFSANGYLNPWL